MSKRELSAKDKAFERERVRLQSSIRKKDEEIAFLNREISKRDIEIAELKVTVEILEQSIGIPKDTILENAERNKKIESFIQTTMGLLNL